VVIPAYSDHEYCLFGTYSGGDAGLHEYDAYQTQFGHHIVLLQSFADPVAYPDGTVVECSNPSDETMINVRPFIIAPTFGAGENLFSLPEGMAAVIHAGDRYLIQSHYVNTSANDILVRDVVNLGMVSEDSVQLWAAPLVFTQVAISLPPHQTSSVQFDCTMESDLNVMFMFGHLHEWGTSFETGRVSGDSVDPMVNISPWQAEYRDAPPVSDFSKAPLELKIGDVVRTTCNWNNDTDDVIEFPHEMSAAAGMAYPSKVPYICSD